MTTDRGSGIGDRGAGGAARTALLLASLVCLALAAGCRLDMHDGPRHEPLQHSPFFEDGRSSRDLVEGTVARGQLDEDRLLHTGLIDGLPAEVFPFQVTREVLERGRERYDIFCAACHGRTGDGDGIVTQRGFRAPQTLHSDRLRGAPLGYYYDVIANGFGVMPPYRVQIPAADRWSIVAYIRALQLSRHATLDDVPAGEREALLAGGGAGEQQP